MRQLLVLFLLIGTLSVGAQNSKFERKVKRCIKTNDEMVFICNIPKQDFQIGKYTVRLDTTKTGQDEYKVVEHNIPIVHVKVYDSNIIKLERIALMPSLRVVP